MPDSLASHNRAVQIDIELPHVSSRATVGKSMNVIGLAGKSGCGKSAVARRLASRDGVVWIDLDRLAWQTYHSGSAVHKRLVDRFGREILDADGAIDRRRLADRAFGDPNGRGDLEAIVHPAVMDALRTEIAEQRRRGVETLLVEGAVLLHSSHVDRSVFDVLIWFDVSDQVRAERLAATGRPEQAGRVPDLPAESLVGVQRLPADGTIAEVADRLVALISGGQSRLRLR